MVLHLKRHTLCQFFPLGCHYTYRHLGPHGNLSRSGLPAGSLRSGQQVPVCIHTVGGIFRILCQPSPCHGHIAIVVHGHDTASQRLLDAL